MTKIGLVGILDIYRHLIKEYIDQIEDKNVRILIPGAGNGYEAEYLFRKGFNHVFVLDISDNPLKTFAERVPEFPKSQLIQENFFTHKGEYDLIIEQTFFCSFLPTKEKRSEYVSQMSTILNSKGKLVGLWFDIPLKGDMEKRPFWGDKICIYLIYKVILKWSSLRNAITQSLKDREMNFLGSLVKLNHNSILTIKN